MKSRNCEKNRAGTLRRFPSSSLLGPYRSSRRAASAPVRPAASAPRAASASAAPRACQGCRSIAHLAFSHPRRGEVPFFVQVDYTARAAALSTGPVAARRMQGLQNIHIEVMKQTYFFCILTMETKAAT